MTCHAMLSYAMPCYAMQCFLKGLFGWCYAMPCHAMSCHASVRHGMACHAMLCYAIQKVCLVVSLLRPFVFLFKCSFKDVADNRLVKIFLIRKSEFQTP